MKRSREQESRDGAAAIQLLRRCSYGARPLTPQMLLEAVRWLWRRPPHCATIDLVQRFVSTRFHLPPPGRSASAGARDVARKLQSCIEVGVLEKEGDMFLPTMRFCGRRRLCARDVHRFWAQCALLRRRRSQGTSCRRHGSSRRCSVRRPLPRCVTDAATQTSPPRRSSPSPVAAGDTPAYAGVAHKSSLNKSSFDSA